MSAALALTVLGTGNAFAEGGHPYSCYLLERLAPAEGEARAVLLDCGPTAIPMLRGMGFDLARIDLVLLSHLHGDHIAGVPFLLLDYQFRTRRDRPLLIAGPPGTEEKCEGLFRLCYTETVEMMARRFETGYRVLPEGEVSEAGGLRILPRKVRHQHREIPYGFRIEWAGRALGWSGDTEWDEALVDLARGTDLFLVECNTAGWQLRFHLSLEDLEREAHRLETKRLLLTHMGEATRQRLAGGKPHFEAAREGARIEF